MLVAKQELGFRHFKMEVSTNLQVQLEIGQLDAEVQSSRARSGLTGYVWKSSAKISLKAMGLEELSMGV